MTACSGPSPAATMRCRPRPTAATRATSTSPSVSMPPMRWRISRSEMGSVPFSGNVGLRWVKTDITSIGFRQGYRIIVDTVGDTYSIGVDPDLPLETNRVKGSYDYFLPSANIAVRPVAGGQAAPRRLSRHRALGHRKLRRRGQPQSDGVGDGRRRHHLQRDHRQPEPQAAARMEPRRQPRTLCVEGHADFGRGLL